MNGKWITLAILAGLTIVWIAADPGATAAGPAPAAPAGAAASAPASQPALPPPLKLGAVEATFTA